MSKKFLSDVLIECGLQVDGTTTLGTATATTVATSDNSTNIATTAWVKALGYSTTDSFISNVSFSGSTLSFTGINSAFTGSIDLSTLSTQLTDIETVYARVRNVSGVLILKGTPLATVIGQTSGNVSDVVPADASNPAFMPALFVADEDIAEEAEGRAVAYGEITGIDTSLYPSGTTVYVAPGGGWTDIKPTGTDLIQNLGVITKQHNTNGGGIVTGVGRSNDVPNIPQGYAWVGNANGVATPTLLGSLAYSSATYDNYGSWNLKTNGVQRTTVQSGGNLDIVAGTDISVSYSAGGVVTINSTATGSIDYIDDVRLNGNSLDFSGQGSAFSGSVDLSSLTPTVAVSALTDVDLTGLTNNAILKYDSVNQEWVVSTTNDTANATATAIVPFAIASVNTTSNGSGIGISWSNWNSSNATLDFTFSTPQPNTDYIVITDTEVFDNYYVGISNKTVNGFRAEFYDDTQSRTPSSFSEFSFIVYASDPTQQIKSSVGGINELSDVDTVTSAPSNGEALVWDGTNWVPGTISTTNNYLTGLSFNTGNGVLTATRQGLSDLTVDLDGRYLTSYTETDTLQSVTDRGATTSNTIEFTGAANAYVGIQGETDVNLKIGTGAGSEPRMYLFGSANGQSNAGNVFIGTANNTGMVDINGDVDISGFAGFNGITAPDFPVDISSVDGGKVLRSTRGTSIFRIDQSNDGPGYIGMQSADDLSIQTNNTSKMYITSGGNVGIGTTSPSAKLHINGGTTGDTVKFLIGGNDSIIKLGDNGAGGPHGIQFDYETTNGDGMSMYYRTSPQHIVFENSTGTSGTGVMVIQRAGNVGIGTTSPAAQLQIDTPASNSAGQGLRLNRPSAGTHYHSVEFATNGTVDWSVGQNLNDAFEVYENGAAATTRLTIKEGGNVGIGTTSPSKKLHVYTSDNEGIFLQGTGGGVWMDMQANTANIHSIGAQTGGMGIYNRTVGAYRMFITDGGNVGIGTTSPSTKLDVNGVITATGGNSTQWNSAYGWGDHSVQGYLTSYTETDTLATVTSRGASTTSAITTGGITATYGWFGGTGIAPQIRIFTENGTASIADTFADTSTDKSYIHFLAGTNSNDPGYIMHETSESADPDERNEGVLHLVPSDDNSYGDYVSIHGTNDPDCVKIHTNGMIETSSSYQLQLRSGSGYVRVDDGLSVASQINTDSHGDSSQWNTAYGWGDHSTAGYLTSFTETDPIFTASAASGIAAGDITNWNNAFAWGDHSAEGYMLQPQWVQPITSGFGFHDDLGSAGDLNWAIGATDRGGVGQPGQNAFIMMKRTDGVEFTGLTGGTEVFTLDDSGNLGLSNSTPVHRLDVNGNIMASGYIMVGNNTAVRIATGSATGAPTSTKIESFDSATFIGAFLDFTIYDDGKDHMRSGTLQVVFNGAEARFNEVNTLDIGDTSQCTLDVQNNGGIAEVFFTSPDPSYHIKYQVRTL